ncbi:MAG: High-affnity carbon uptake protein Hat/HatR [Nitrospira sp.]|jgi:WD40 repeat protein|nr:MAG: High-affnity carbon uptake protein Hat/HatR [Nitrospira sp.]
MGEQGNVITLSEPHTELNAHNPWPGLDAYEEASHAFFFGRDEEAAEMFRLVRLAPLTVVYGKSGLGKTSLLQAGLYPELRKQHYLPVHVRLQFANIGMVSPLQQVMRRLTEEMDRGNTEYPQPRDGGSLWEYLHRKDLKIWSCDNFPLTPVLVFDQFEELFSHKTGDPELITDVIYGLADLIENRIPPELLKEGARAVRSSLDLRSQHYRIVLSFREDFLPEVKTWEEQIPSLLRNCLRLNPMSRDRAIEAVSLAGKAVLDAEVAPFIVDLIGRRDHASDTANPSEMVVEPVLLSLCCSRLNARRTDGTKIDQVLVEQTGQDILDGFYREALDDDAVKGPPDVALFIENYLIQGDHFRGDYPREEALNKNLLAEKQLAALTDKHRLLRIVPHPDTTRVELIHDRLVPVVRKARDERKIKQHQEEQERLARLAQDERDKERARSEELQAERDTARHSLKIARLMRNIAAVTAILSLVVIGWGLRERAEKERAKQSITVAVNTARLAEGRLALGTGMEPLEQTIYRGLAAYRLSLRHQGLAEVRAASLTMLHSVMERTAHLHKAFTVHGLVPTPALAYSPDGKTIAVGGEDGLIRLLDAETYHETGKLDCGQSAPESVWSLAYNSGGTRLAAGYSTNDDKVTGNGLVCVFDVEHRKQLHRFEKDGVGDIYSVAYGGTPETEFIVSGGTDKMLRLWDIKTGKPREFSHKDKVIAAAVSHDNGLVASGGDDGIIRLWDRDTLAEQPGELHGHGATVQQVVFSPTDQNLLISAGDDGLIIAWNLTERCRTQQSTQQPVKIVNFALGPDGLIAAASADGYVRVFRLLENVTPCTNPKGKAITSPPTPEFLMIQDGEFPGHGGFVLGTAFNPEGTRLASTGQDGSIRIWSGKSPGFSLAQLDLSSGAEVEHTSSRPGNVTTLAISPNSESITVGDDNGTIYLWNSIHQPDFNPVTLKADRHWHAHDKAIRSLAFLRIGNQSMIVSGGDDGVVKRWDAASQDGIGPDMEDQAEPIRSIAVSPDEKLVAAGSTDGTIRLWDIATGKRIRRLEKPSYAQEDYELYTVSFTGDGTYLAVGDSYTGLRMLDVTKPEYERILQGHTEPVKSVSRGGARWLLSAGTDGRLLEWEQSALTQPPISGLRKHDEFKSRLGYRDPTPLTSIDTSRDGKLILIGGHRGRIELWDGDEQVQISAHFLGHQTADIQAVALAPDRSFFVTADTSTVLLWPGPDQWANIICSKLDKNMSTDQWHKWVSKAIDYEIQCQGLPPPNEQS